MVGFALLIGISTRQTDQGPAKSAPTMTHPWTSSTSYLPVVLTLAVSCERATKNDTIRYLPGHDNDFPRVSIAVTIERYGYTVRKE